MTTLSRFPLFVRVRERMARVKEGAEAGGEGEGEDEAEAECEGEAEGEKHKEG